MAETHTILLLCKGLIQISLFFASLIRYNVFSFVYLLFLLVSPFASFDNRGCFLAFIIALVACSSAFTLCHVAFQTVLAAHQPYGSLLSDCESDLLWRQIGLQPLHRAEFYHIARLLCPEPLTLLVSVGMLAAIWRHRDEFFPAAVGDACPDCGVLDGYRRNLKRMGDWLMFVLFLALMCSAAICLPCLLSSVYLLSFLLAALLWTAGRLDFRRRGLRWQRRWLALYTACHLACIFLYQFPASQKFERLRANSTAARLLGLHYLIQSNCSSAQVHFASSVRSSEYASPLLILVFYFYLALQIHLHDRRPHRSDYKSILTVDIPHGDFSASEPMSPGAHCHSAGFKQPQLHSHPAHPPECLIDAPFPILTESILLRQQGPRRTTSEPLALLTMPPRGSAAAPMANSVSDAASDIAAEFSAAASTLDDTPSSNAAINAAVAAAAAVVAAASAASPQPPPPPPPPPPARAPSLESSTLRHEAKLTWLLYTLSDPLVKLFHRLRQFLMGASYILTLVSMMAWSVTYVSFCTLPFLLLSCLLWLSPGTRRFTLGLSPLLVVYSTGLLLANYAFNFNLPEVYLASKNESSFAQIGLQVYEAPMVTFAAQLTFCCVFYFTLWTFLSERRQGVSHDTRAALELYHLRGHLLNRRRRKTMETLIIEVMSKYSLIICCTFWVLMCSRSVVNISHIIVMAIFLYFIITFRLFYSFWRRQLIFCFWGIMLYSMLTLLLIYAYQFQSVPDFIHRLTKIESATLKEIGIEKYETPQLFLNLLFPTSFIIVIMIHVKNFHKTFLQLSNLQPNLDPSATEQPVQQPQSAPMASSSIERPFEIDVELTAPALSDSEIDDDLADPAAAAAATGVSAASGGGGGAGKRGTFNAKTAAIRRTLLKTQSYENAVLRQTKMIRKDLNALIVKANALYSLYSKKFSPTLWRFLEVHWHKAVGMVIVCTATGPTDAGNFEAANFIYIALLPLYLAAPDFVSVLYLFWSAFLILGKMIYQLGLVHTAIDRLVVTNCTSDLTPPEKDSNATYLPTRMDNNAKYFGFFVTADGAFFSYIIQYMAIVVCLAFQHIISLHQRKYYLSNPRPMPGIVFPNFAFADFEKFYRARVIATSSDSSTGLVGTLLKLLANFGCYKFGLELTYTATVVVSCLRLDMFSCLYMLFLLIFTFMQRSTVRRLWVAFRLLLCCAFLAQFLLACGYPPMLCLEYPWFRSAHRAQASIRYVRTDNFRHWMFLPAYNAPPLAQKLIADYFLLVLVACQHRVFKAEVYNGGPGYDSSNDPVWRDVAPMLRLRNSFMNSKSADLLILLFRLIFSWIFWACPFLLLILGFLSFNMFSFLYILTAFYFIGKGHRFLLQQRKKVIQLWNAALGLNVFVVLCKCLLQIIGCSFPNRSISDWKHQVFGIQCLNMKAFTEYAIDNSWDSSVNNPGIVMDMVCFIFMIVQKRVFLTTYFTEVRLDTEIQNSFTSKGARIITLSLKRQKEQNQAEELNEVKYIRRKVENLKSRKRQKRELTEHFQAIRSGTRDLFYTVDADGNKVLTIDESAEDEPDPHWQPTAAENLIEQGLLKATEFAQKPGEMIRKTINTLGQRRYSRSVSINEDELKRLVAGSTPTAGAAAAAATASSVLSGEERQSLLLAGPTIPEELELVVAAAAAAAAVADEADAATGLTDRPMQLQLQNSLIEVPPPPTTPVLSPSSTLVDLNEALLMRSIGSDYRQSPAPTDYQRPPLQQHLQSPAQQKQLLVQQQQQQQHPPPPPVRGLGDVGDGSIGRGHRTAAGFHPATATAVQLCEAGLAMPGAIGDFHDDRDYDAEELEDEEGAEAEGPTSRTWSLVWFVVSALGRNLLALLRVICRLLDRATADYRKIKDEMMQSKLDAKDERLGESVVDSQGFGELNIRPYPEECIQDDDTSSDVPLESLPEPQTLGQAAGQLLLLLQYLLFSRLTPLCYLAMVTYHLVNCTVFSLSYPLVVFMWGMLSVPFPTKRFWLSAIAYTMLLIVIKYALQFTVIKKELIRELPHRNLSSHEKFAEWFAKEIGATSDYSTPVAEIIILGLLFLQRSSLKRYGLWDISRQHTTAMFYPGAERHRASQETRGSVGGGAAEPSTMSKEGAGSGGNSAKAPVAVPDPDIAHGGVRYRRYRPTTAPAPPSPSQSPSALPSPLAPELIDADVIDGIGSEDDDLGPSRHTLDTVAVDERSGRRSGAKSSSCLLSCLTCHPFREFFKKIADPNISVRVDLYSWMFISEFVSLLIIFFGYTAGFAGPGRVENENIITYISKEEIPLTLTVTMFVQFAMLLVDRGLFLTRSRRGKFFFHLLHVILLHVYLKFILPHMTSPEYVARSWVIKMFYSSKCLYFALSAYQILSGYPSRVLGNFICMRQNYLNLFSFKIYLIIPFLFELRSIMDWMLTNTALSISHWLLVEDIYSVIFVSKCWRRAEIDYPTERAKNRSPCYKYCPGFWLIALIVACIWAPVLWFSVMSNVFLEINHVTSCTSELSIGSFTPLYTLRTTSVKGFTPENRTSMHDCFAEKGEETRKRIGHLLQSTTAYIVEFDGMSSVLWTITPPSRRALSKELRNNRSTVRLFFKLECLRSKDGGVSRKKVFDRELGFGTPVRESLIRVLNNSAANASVTFNQIGDRFLLLSSDPAGGMEPLSNSLPNEKLNISKIDIQADLRSDEMGVSWWELQDIYTGNFLCPSNRTGRPLTDNDMHNILRLVFFSERAKSENRLIQAIQRVGMYGILSVFVISIARVLRAGIIPRHYLVMYVDMPHVDRILSLLHDIYLVRESEELELEEELFAKLLYLFRSPSMLIRYTQTPESILRRFYEEPQQPADTQGELAAASGGAEEAAGGGSGGHCRKPSDTASKHKHE